MKEYMVSMSIRGTHTLIVKNCKSKAEARRKLIDLHEDVEGIDFEIETRFPRSARIYESKVRKKTAT